VWCLVLISIQDSAFQAICRNTVAGLMIGIQTALEKPERRKTMRTKTNVKAGMSLSYTKIEWKY
jgi:hypothetical protein